MNNIEHNQDVTKDAEGQSRLNDGLAVLPCPFCGSSDISDGEVLSEKPNGQTFTQSMCCKCGALGPEMQIFSPDYGDIEAIRGWNMRVANAKLTGGLTAESEKTNE